MLKHIITFTLLSTLTACTNPQTSTADQPLVIGGWSAVSLSSGSNHDVQFQFDLSTTKTVVYLTPHASGSTLTGLNVTANPGTNDPGVSSNSAVWLYNTSATVPITLAHQTGSSGANRITTRTGASYELSPQSGVMLFMDYTNVGMWLLMVQPETEYATYVDTEIAAANSYTDAEIASIDFAPYALTAVVGSSPSLALNTARRPSTTRPTRVNVYATVALSSTLLAAQSATLEMHSDSSATPSAVVAGPLTASLGGVLATTTMPITLSYDLPANHYYMLVQTAGAGVITIQRIQEQPY